MRTAFDPLPQGAFYSGTLGLRDESRWSSSFEALYGDGAGG